MSPNTAANQQPTGRLLKVDERKECKGLVGAENPHGRRAQTLLALDDGSTQVEAGQISGLTDGQVRYCFRKFREVGMSIFPPELIKNLPDSKVLNDSQEEVEPGKPEEEKSPDALPEKPSIPESPPTAGEIESSPDAGSEIKEPGKGEDQAGTQQEKRFKGKSGKESQKEAKKKSGKKTQKKGKKKAKKKTQAKKKKSVKKGKKSKPKKKGKKSKGKKNSKKRVGKKKPKKSKSSSKAMKK